jgi:pimeloyl-ACP methyl ester carboxylesterase
MRAYPQPQFHAIDFNPTPRDFEHMTVTGQINRLRQYVLDHGLEPLCLVGSSLGGQVALHYAHRYGGVLSLLLLAPALHDHAGRDPADELAAWEATGQRSIWHDAFGQEVPLRFQFHLDRQQYAQPPPPPAPAVIIHGVGDEVIPVASSRTYAAAYPEEVQLVEVDSGHRLVDQLELIWTHLSRLALA